MRRAFTLVELMVVMVLISIMAGMVTVAVQSVQQDARITRCRNQVQGINELLIQRMEEFMVRRISAGEPVPSPPSPAIPDAYVLTAENASRARLIFTRHAFCRELPDRKSDLTDGPLPLQLIQRKWEDGRLPAPRQPSDCRVEYRSIATPEPAVERYRAIVSRLRQVPLGSAFNAGWTEDYEGSECLYLILATSMIGGRSGLDLVPRDQIGDLDGDMVPEILDPWGTPVVWMRWPIGYWLQYGRRNEWAGWTQAERADYQIARRLAMGQDQFDPLRVDWRNMDNDEKSPASRDTFNIPPVVVSAGPDRLFDLQLRSSGTSDWQYGARISYPTMTWRAGNALPDAVGHINFRIYYPDPFARDATRYNYDTLSGPLKEGWVGAYYDANNDGDDNSSDNIFSAIAPY